MVLRPEYLTTKTFVRDYGAKRALVRDYGTTTLVRDYGTTTLGGGHQGGASCDAAVARTRGCAGSGLQ
eukprot:2402891-Rhodomonas_salina.1